MHANSTLQNDGIHNKRKQIVFDGTETGWYQYGSNVACHDWDNRETPFHRDDSLQGYKCNIAVETTGASQTKNDNTFVTYNSINGQTVVDWIVFHINMSITDWKAYLAKQYANGTPITVEYELQEEVIIPYKGVQQEQYNAMLKAISYDEQTNVSSNTIALFDIIALRNMNTILNTLESDVDLLE